MMQTTYGILAAIAAVVAVCTTVIPAEATNACVTTDSTLLSTVEAKITRHSTETGRTDLHEMFTKSYNTMKGNDSYTTSDIKARADKQGSNWQGAGPNTLWQSIYAELDRLETCRANLQTDTTPPVITITGSGTITINKGDSYTDAGATCVDDTDGAISPVSSGTVDTTTAGTYTITYSCTDAASNAAVQVLRVVTVQDAQPTPQDTPIILPPEFKFLTMSPPGTITEGVPATFTLTSLPAPSSPLDVVMDVQSPSGHLNSTEAGERTITVPTSGSANFTIYTINTPEAKEGTLVVNVTRPAGYTAGPATNQLGIRDDTTPPATPTPSENLVQNGSFEAPVVSGWSHISSGTAGLEWSVSGGPIEIHNGILGGASDGSQHIELDSTGSVTISQTISTTSGQSYDISFDYKARPDTTQSTNAIQVQWNGADIASGITFGDTWKTHTVTVTGTGSDTLSFMDMGTSDGLGTFLDNVSVAASDVPQTQQGGGPLFTGQSIQPGGGGTPTFVLFGIGVPADTITEGGVANVTISTTPAPTTPLDVIVKVSSSSGHVNTANHTISIPTSGSVVFSVQTINTAEHKDGNILIAIQNTNDYLVDGFGAVTIAIKDDPSTLQSNHLRATIDVTPPAIFLGESFTVNINHNFPPDMVLGGSSLTNGQFSITGLGTSPRDSVTVSADDIDEYIGFGVLRIGVNQIVYTYYIGSDQFNTADTLTIINGSKAILHAVDVDQYISFNAMLRHPAGQSGLGHSYWIIWYVNDEPQINHANTPRNGVLSASNWYKLFPQDKPTSHTDSPLVYNVYATLVNHDGSIIYDKTETKTFTYNPPAPPMPASQQLSEMVTVNYYENWNPGNSNHDQTIVSSTVEYDYASLWGWDLNIMWEDTQWYVKPENIKIGNRNGTGMVSLDGASIYLGECRNTTQRSSDIVQCDINKKHHRDGANIPGMHTMANYGHSILHEYKLTGSQISAINSIDKPYVFMKSDGDTIFKPAGKLYRYD